MASDWNLWVWLECIGVAVRRYIDILIIIITFPYSTCISTFWLFLCSFNPSSTSKDDVKVNNRTYITITENFTFT